MRQLILTVVDDTLEALKAKGELKLEARPAYSVDPPKNAAHGDAAVNVAMVLAKAEGKPPRKIAEAIVAALVDKAGVIAKVDIAGPGFLNFTLNDAVVQRIAREVLTNASFGRHAKRVDDKGEPQRVLVEFVSANPTGPVHIGHARGAFMGDAVARLLDAAGYAVTREFYINDFGNQIEILGRSLYKRYLQQHGQDVELAAGEYPGEYLVEVAKVLKAEDGDKHVGKPESEWLARCTEVAIRENLKAIRATLEKAEIRFDSFFSEASLHQGGKVKGVAQDYVARGATYEGEAARGTEEKVRRDESKAAKYSERQLGGTFLKTSEHGDDEDRILLRHDGSPVYLTADLAYHQAKFARGFTRMVDVFGADHAGHVPRIRAGMRLLGVDDKKLDFLLVQMVRFVREGTEVKLSKRAGNVFELTDLIDEVGPDVCRFTFLMRAANAQFDFDLDAVKRQSKDNPVFYFQYGHARCAQILKKAEEQGKPFVGIDKVTDAQLALLVLPEERALLKKMSLFGDVVVGAAEALEPHRVLYFCQELLSEFHGYYSKYKGAERVVSDDVDKTQGRLALVAALKQTLKSAFALLGISAPEFMTAPPDEVEED
jgi:arginyl-tRNA synthetase